MRRLTLALAAALLFVQPALAESRREAAERLIAEQERLWHVSCRSVHPKAYHFVRGHIAELLDPGIEAAGAAAEERYSAVSTEALQLSDQTLKCHGIEPLARNGGVPFETDFGELHEVLRTAHELLESVITKKPEVLRQHSQSELRKRYEELNSSTGRRYRAR